MIEKLQALKIIGGNPKELVSYLNTIVNDSDEYVSAGALYQLLQRNMLDEKYQHLIASHLHHSCVRRLAVFYYLTKGEHQAAKQAFEVEKKVKPYNHIKRLQFALEKEINSLVESEAGLFLENGQIEHLFKAATYAREVGGESEALPWMIRATMIAPMHPPFITQVYELLEQEGNMLDLESLTSNLIAWGMHPAVSRIYLARVLLNKNNLAKFNDVFSTVNVDRLNRNVKSKAYGLLAEAREKEGNYRKASDFYLKQNNPDMVDNKAQRDSFINEVIALENIQFDGVPPDPSPKQFMMLGFPRSGTTLLENMLMCHPKIETFEETNAFTILKMAIPVESYQQPAPYRSIKTRVVDNITWHAACASYYDQLQHSRVKKGATILIYKLPILSAYAGLLSNCFPGNHYIFSIRHPYDVVLSCYKQWFFDTPAMEHFKRFEDACALYDFVMTRWFTHFPVDDPSVCYIKYESLVDDFQSQITRVLEFLGAGWNENIMKFSELAKLRPSRTPSYSKVRQGLELGVQSSWEKYIFLFTSTNRKHLDPWVSKFGYEGI